jgi:hypothetical protein
MYSKVQWPAFINPVQDSASGYRPVLQVDGHEHPHEYRQKYGSRSRLSAGESARSRALDLAQPPPAPSGDGAPANIHAPATLSPAGALRLQKCATYGS